MSDDWYGHEDVTYSRLERLHFWLFKRWPDRVVERRLATHDRNVARAIQVATKRWGGGA